MTACTKCNGTGERVLRSPFDGNCVRWPCHCGTIPELPPPDSDGRRGRPTTTGNFKTRQELEQAIVSYFLEGITQARAIAKKTGVNEQTAARVLRKRGYKRCAKSNAK